MLLALLAMTAMVKAQATQPAAVEQQPLQATAKTVLPTTPQSSTPTGGDLLGIKQLFVGLMIVLSLILGGKWMLPRIWPAVGAHRNSAVRVIGRTPISPKNQLVLVHVGQRVLVLGENASQLSTLSTIENPDEVALLLSRASTRIDRETERDVEREPKFAAALNESNRAYETPMPDASHAEASQPDEKASSVGELSDLISKVRGLARHINRS